MNEPRCRLEDAYQDTTRLTMRSRVARLAGVALLATALIGVGVAPGSDDRAAAAEACGTQPCTWNFTQARVPAAQELGRSGSGVTVAVVDTWIDADHPELRGRVARLAYCASGEGTCRDNTYSRDRCEHGTHVAGTVASTRHGVAPRARVLGVQVLRYDPAAGACSGTTNDVAGGIRFAAAKGARVINLSLGGLVPGLFQSAQVTDAVSAAARAGSVVIFSAGNSTVPLTDDYGANAVLVAATGPNGGLASYSSRGGAVSLAAPGGDDGAAGLARCRDSTCILSTIPNGKYALLEGTSMAAPHVSGTAALLFAQHPGRSRSDVIATLQRTARPLGGSRHGRLDATAALQLGATQTATTHRPIGRTALRAPNPTASSRAGVVTPPPTAAATATKPAPKMTSWAAMPMHTSSPTGGPDVNLGWEPPEHDAGSGGLPVPFVGVLLVLIAAVGVGIIGAMVSPRRGAGSDRHDRDP